MASRPQRYDVNDDDFGISGLRVILAILRALLISIIFATIWSYGETQDFFTGTDASWLMIGNFGIVSNALSALFQFGQSPIFWLAFRALKMFQDKHSLIKSVGFEKMTRQTQDRAKLNLWKYGILTAVFLSFWILFCIVDGGSNWIEVTKRTYETPWSMIVMKVVAVACVFIEELFLYFLDIHNDLRKKIQEMVKIDPTDFDIWLMTLRSPKKATSTSGYTSRYNTPAPKPSYSAPSKEPAYSYPEPVSRTPERQVTNLPAGVSKGFPINSLGTLAPGATQRPLSSLAQQAAGVTQRPIIPAPKLRDVPLSQNGSRKTEPTYHTIGLASERSQGTLFNENDDDDEFVIP